MSIAQTGTFSACLPPAQLIDERFESVRSHIQLSSLAAYAALCNVLDG